MTAYTLVELNKEKMGALYESLAHDANTLSDFGYLLDRINDNEEFGDFSRRSNKATHYGLEKEGSLVALVEFVYTPAKLKIMDIHNLNSAEASDSDLHRQIFLHIIKMCFDHFSLIKLYLRQPIVYNTVRDVDFERIKTALEELRLGITVTLEGRFIQFFRVEQNV